MFELDTNRRILQILDGTIDNALSGFITDRRSRQLSPRTIDYYQEKLTAFRKFIGEQGIEHLREITAEVLRLYMLNLSRTCTNGGIHAHYRALRSFFNWCEAEFENTFNPIKKISPPKINNHSREGISINDVMRMVDACKSNMAIRDKAILLTLTDTGCRGSEFISLNVGDLDISKGEIFIRHGKGDKSREVYIGRNSIRYLKRYLTTRHDLIDYSPLWITNDGCRLAFSGLREIIRRRAREATVNEPGIHDFRRCFAIEFLRNDGDIFTLQKILGHSSLEMVKRYLALAKSDCELVHRKASPIDNWRK
jgi:site-specific recombinase XerD